MQKLTSLENPTIKMAANLKKHKYRRELAMFLTEGRRAVMEAKQRPELIQSILVEEQLITDHELLAGFDPHKIYVTNARVMRHVCNTEQPQGIAIILRKPVWEWNQQLRRKGVMLFLDRISDPGNMGSILRSAWALGVEGVMLGRGCVDYLSPKVVRASMGAILNVPIFSDVSPRLLDELEECGFLLMATDLIKGVPYYQVELTAPLLLIFGSEAEGVSPELKERCQAFIKIPMNPQVDSLNVAAACAIIIAEAARQSRSGT